MAGRLSHFRVLVLSVLGLRSPGAHETIDAEGVNAISAATDTAAARLKSAAGSAAEGEAMFALGIVRAEATAVLNRDLAAHSGQSTTSTDSHCRRHSPDGNWRPASMTRSAATACRRPRSSKHFTSRLRQRTHCARGSSF